MNLGPNHPYWFARDVLRGELYASTIRLSYYKYTPQTLLDERTDYEAHRDYFLNPDFITSFLENCPPDHEVALDSIIIMQNGEIRHLPMIDMSTASKAHLSKLMELLGEQLFNRFAWFSSGRSFHGYGSDLMSQSEWVRFMGTLLLGNKKDLKPTVDPRWIGHRLISGYSSLRWSKNTSHYLGLPNRIL